MLFSLLLPAATFAQGGYYKLTVKLNKINPKAVAYLCTDFGRLTEKNGQKTIDSALVKNGKFEFKGKVDEPKGVTLVVDHLGIGTQLKKGMGDSHTLFLEKGEIVVKNNDSVKNASVTGGPTNVLQTEYLNKVLAGYYRKLLILSKQSQEVLKSKDRVALSKLGAKSKDLQRELDSLRTRFMYSHTDNFLTLHYLLSDAKLSAFRRINVDLYSKLSPELKNTPSGKQLARAIEEQSAFAVGAVAPDFTQNDINDKPVSLSDFRGKYVLLDFWASWCLPCRMENPFVVKAYQAYNKKGFTVLGVSLDYPGQKQAWLKAIEKDQLPWTHVSDLKGRNNAIAIEYKITSVPANLLISPDGKILARDLRGEALEKELAKHMQ